MISSFVACVRCSWLRVRRLVLLLLLPVGWEVSGRMLNAADWEGATVKEELLDASMQPSNRMVSMASTATRRGCRVAKVEGGVVEGYTVRLDGVAGPRWPEIAKATPVFSENGASVAYCARRGLEWRWVINGVEGPAFPEMTATSFAFSPDGKRHAYIAIAGFRRTALIVDGATVAEGSRDKLQPWDLAPRFNADGSRLAWVESDQTTRQMRVILDGRPGPWNRGISVARSPGFGAFPVAAEGGSLPDAQARPDVFNMDFSGDGKHFAYCVDLGGKWSMHIDGKPGPAHESFGFGFAFTADGSDHAYMARDGSGRSIVRAKGEHMPVEVYLDWTLTFSPDGRHLAFAGTRDGMNAVWLDGKAAPCDIPIVGTANYGSVRFSPDSKRLAFSIKAAGPELHWVVDGKAGPGSNVALGQFDFSADSGHFAYILPRKQTDDVAIVLDGKVRAAYFTVPSGPVFREDGTLEFLAVKDNALFRYTITGY